MRTDHLITALVADAPKKTGAAGHGALVLVPAALAMVLAVFVIYLRVRPDLTSGFVWLAVTVKIVATAALAIGGLRFALALAQPGRKTSHMLSALLVVPAILILALGVELTHVGLDNWQDRLVGTNQLRCLIMVPLLSFLPLLALLVALRRGAVTRPALAGLVSGLAAAGMGASFYALNCTDDSMLFVLTWYGLAAALVSALGTLGGRVLLRW